MGAINFSDTEQRLRTISKQLDEWAESEEGIKYFENLKIIRDIKLLRYKKFEEYLNTHDFDLLFYRIILQHDDKYRENCYHNGIEPHPNNILQFILDYVVDNHEPINIKELDCDFPNNIFLFKGYYFQIIWGQGCIIKIINKDDMRNILTI